MVLRIIDQGTVSHLRSQSIYHGLAYARTEDTPDTIVTATPSDPYVCIGFHQDLHQEVDLDFCTRYLLPVLRRETGGGTVYLDRNQLFVQWVMAPQRLPLRMDNRFELFTRPLIHTYRDLGIPAAFRPPNDVHVHDRKIVGTGAGHIGNADVVVGNFIFDFDTDRMSRILRTPSPAFHEHVTHGLDTYMTSIRRELGTTPARDEVTSRYLQHCETVLGQDFESGELTPGEIHAIEEVEQRFQSEEFLQGSREPPDPDHRAVKIHEDVWIFESLSTIGDLSLRATATVRQDRIDRITLQTEPDSNRIHALEQALQGTELNEESVSLAVRDYDGSVPDELISAILNLRKHPQSTTHERRP